jgi:hypothetical protein
VNIASLLDHRAAETPGKTALRTARVAAVMERYLQRLALFLAAGSVDARGQRAAPAGPLDDHRGQAGRHRRDPP